MNYIAVNLYRKIINHAISEGISRDFLDDLPTGLNSLEQVQAVPADHFFLLHEKLDEQLGPGFAVRVGQQMKINDYGVLGLSWRTCSWAGEIFARSERYFRLLSDTYVFKVEKSENVSKVYLYRKAYRRGVALSNEATFSATVVVLQAITETNITPVAVSFSHAPPQQLTSHQQAFQCPVLFNQPYDFIAYKTSDLELPTAKADASINQFLLERVKEETNGIEISPGKIAQDVETLIKDALPSGIPAVGQIGRIMGMSSRTLTRRLAEKGITFRDLVSQSQFNVAKSLLLNSSRSVAEIAFETGFSEQSAFNRAFKRWTGQSPLEFRQRK